ncbi:MAG: entericidin A/B family lipoprotein [Thioclava marina]|jgi:Entericidin EcnA/B family.|nr:MULTISPECIES: entericidin A/B family lipoprotein [Thioclava]MBC7145638.1 entericidin A/B family lipoprotein [Thioclava marina]MBD3802394.1 entericidin A/B family lipoprotein [Thioclava sp.]TNE84788.1 MAG: entericidin A/B family lipoprotein [Paracoccaceae bacterium]TNF11548.1 MAG: entericidin A/B family lipoprotein [Paracoccaceae bacterium]
MTKTVKLGAAMALVILGLAACNTVRGAGQDLSVAGSTIASEANKAQ